MALAEPGPDTILAFRLAILDWRKPYWESVPPILSIVSSSQIGMSGIPVRFAFYAFKGVFGIGNVDKLNPKTECFRFQLSPRRSMSI